MTFAEWAKANLVYGDDEYYELLERAWADSRRALRCKLTEEAKHSAYAAELLASLGDSK